MNIKAENPIQSMPQTRIDVWPSQIITASGLLFDHVDEGLPMWTGDGERSLRTEVNFIRQFKDIPIVHINVIGMDSAQDRNLRYWINAVDIERTGFTIEFKTWGDTLIARLGISWLAAGKY